MSSGTLNSAQLLTYQLSCWLLVVLVVMSCN